MRKEKKGKKKWERRMKNPQFTFLTTTLEAGESCACPTVTKPLSLNIKQVMRKKIDKSVIVVQKMFKNDVM